MIRGYRGFRFREFTCKATSTASGAESQLGKFRGMHHAANVRMANCGGLGGRGIGRRIGTSRFTPNTTSGMLSQKSPQLYRPNLWSSTRRSYYYIAPALQAIHDFVPFCSGNYAASISLLAVTVRACLLPLSWYSIRESGKLARVLPEVQMLHTVYVRNLVDVPAGDSLKRRALTLQFMKGARAIFQLRGVKPYMPFVPVLAQVSLGWAGGGGGEVEGEGDREKGGSS